MPNRLFNYITGLSLLVLFSSTINAADDALFNVQNMTLELNVTHPAIAADILPADGKELIIVGINQQQQPTMAILSKAPDSDKYVISDQFIVNRNIFAFDIGEPTASQIQSLYFLSQGQIWHYVPATADTQSSISPFQDVVSMYIADQASYLLQQDFAKDINNDQQDDFILNHFGHLNLWLSNCCQQRQYQRLPISARLKVHDDGVTFSYPKLFYVDMNKDGKQDIVAVNTGELSVLQQTADGHFSSTPLVIPIATNIDGINWWDKVEADGRNLDQSQLQHRVVEEILDINHDGVTDMIVRFTRSSGVLDKTNDYELYLGELNEGQLQFKSQASSVIQSDETLSGLQIIDIENDGQSELLLSSFDVGLSQIIGALLSGSIDQEILVFSLNEQGLFNQKPMTTQDVEITFSLSRGRSGEPMVKIVDVNGDGYKDMLLSDGNDKLKIIHATPNDKRSFPRRSGKFDILLPANAKDITDSDLNADGKTDLILHYGRLDDPAFANQIKILTAL